MTFKSFIDSPCGIRYMFDTLKLQSPYGRKVLLESKMMKSIGEIEQSYTELREVYEVFVCEEGNNVITDVVKGKLITRLHCLRDISGTISRLKADVVLGDIELFEIKYLAILSEDVREILCNVGLNSIKQPPLLDVVDILDPDGLRINSFYIYDTYSQKLRELRGNIKEINSVLEGRLRVKSVCCKENEDITDKTGVMSIAGLEDFQLRFKLQENMERMQEMEGEIRKELSGRLKVNAVKLECTLRELAKLDILFAKSMQIKDMGLCFPLISMDCITTYKGMFHPQIKEVLQSKGGEFTPVDIDFALEPVTIIGANMGGKTVVLKMAALSQLLFQFGFGIPAENACVDIKNSVILCIGDEQNDLQGLSSFAAEVKAIDNVLCCVKKGERLLALIDEPARTTNPVEGTALVGALLRVLYKKEVSVLLTTHYNIEGEFYKRFRVRGVIDGVMDYRLAEAVTGEIPHEAVGIAESLGIDKEWIGETKKVLNKMTDKI